MFSALKLASLAILCAAVSWAQTAVFGVVNNYSFAKAQTDSAGKPIGNNLLAQGSIFALFGSGLGPANGDGPVFPLPTALPGGTSVAINSGGQSYPAYLYLDLPSQIDGIVPSSVPIGPATITVTYNGQTSSPVPVTIVKSSLGILTFSQNGPAVAQLNGTATNATLSHPARPGDNITLYGTGLGAANGPDNIVLTGESRVGSNVTVNILGKAIPASYAGRSQYPGLDQINFTIPADAATGCYIPAEVTASGQPSNLFYLPIASGSGACTSPFGLSADALAKLDNGGTVNVGVFQMLTAKLSGLQAEGTGGAFDTVDATGVFNLYNKILLQFGGVSYPLAMGNCVVLDSTTPLSGFNVPNFNRDVGGKELLAGPALQLAGSNGNSEGILRATDSNTGNETGGYLGTFLDAPFGAGTWTLTGTGGQDIGAFSAQTTLPKTLDWTNSGNFGTSAGAPRTDLTLTWTGGSVDGNSVLSIFGSSVVLNPTDPSKNRGKDFYCAAPAAAGRFTVPASITQQLPSNTVDASAGEVAFGTLGMSAGGVSNFTAPLKAGGNIDAGVLSYGEAVTIPVKWQ